MWAQFRVSVIFFIVLDSTLNLINTHQPILVELFAVENQKAF